MVLQPGPTDTGGEAPAGSASRSWLPLFVPLCIVFSALLHVEPLAAAELHLQRGVVICVVLSVAALFNWAVLSLNIRVARRPAAREARLLRHPTGTAAAASTGSASRSLLTPFMGLCLSMSAALHAEPLVDAAAEYQIHPAVVVCVVLAGAALFHLAVLSIHKSLVSYQAELPRSRGLPLPAFLVLALAIPTVSSAETVVAAVPIDLPKGAPVRALLALAVSFNVAIGSLYCFVINGPAPPTTADVKMRPRPKAAGAIISCITAAAVISCLPLADGGASGAIAARS